jgi:hypothetical protein
MNAVEKSERVFQKGWEDTNPHKKMTGSTLSVMNLPIRFRVFASRCSIPWPSLHFSEIAIQASLADVGGNEQGDPGADSISLLHEFLGRSG